MMTCAAFVALLGRLTAGGKLDWTAAGIAGVLRYVASARWGERHRLYLVGFGDHRRAVLLLVRADSFDEAQGGWQLAVPPVTVGEDERLGIMVAPQAVPAWEWAQRLPEQVLGAGEVVALLTRSAAAVTAPGECWELAAPYEVEGLCYLVAEQVGQPTTVRTDEMVPCAWVEMLVPGE